MQTCMVLYPWQHTVFIIVRIILSDDDNGYHARFSPTQPRDRFDHRELVWAGTVVVRSDMYVCSLHELRCHPTWVTSRCDLKHKYNKPAQTLCWKFLPGASLSTNGTGTIPLDCRLCWTMSDQVGERRNLKHDASALNLKNDITVLEISNGVVVIWHITIKWIQKIDYHAVSRYLAIALRLQACLCISRSSNVTGGFL